MNALLDGGADLIILETFGDLGELHEAVKTFKEIGSDKALIAQVTIFRWRSSCYGYN